MQISNSAFSVQSEDSLPLILGVFKRIRSGVNRDDEDATGDGDGDGDGTEST